MKVVLLAGGFGTRLSEETEIKPKPMVEIGGKPILWHIMKLYAHYGFDEFIICLGYKGYIIKEYFANYFLHNSDMTFDLKNNSVTVHNNYGENWKVTLIDTGLNTMTGGRIKRIKEYVGNETFMLTYGDGLANVNIHELLEFHKKHGKSATLTSIQLGGRFGSIDMNQQGLVTAFVEKPRETGTWINGGFFVLEPEIFDYIKDDSVSWEKEPLEKLAKEGRLMTYKHNDFWKPMDKLSDKLELEAMWNSGHAAWKIW